MTTLVNGVPLGSTAGAGTMQVSDAGTTTAPVALTVTHVSSAAGGVGNGVAEKYQASNSTPATVDVAQTQAVLTNATAGAEAGAFEVWTRTGGGALARSLRVWGSGALSVGNTNDQGAGNMIIGTDASQASMGYFALYGGSTVVGLAQISGGTVYYSNGSFATLYRGFGGSLLISTQVTLATTSAQPLLLQANSITMLELLGNGSALVAGSGEATATPGAMTLRGANGSGTNIAGANLTLGGGLNTGNAAPGALFFDGGTVGTTGTTLATAIHLAELLDSTTANDTALLLSWYNGTVRTLARVTVGAADSGGVGFRLLRVPN